MHDDFDPRATRDEARERTLALLQKRMGPVMVGEVALACGALWSLEDVEHLLEQLRNEKVLTRIPGLPLRYTIAK